MKFFLLGTDDSCSNYPKIRNWFGKVDLRYANVNEAYKIPARQLLMIEERENTVFPDIISEPFPLISPEVRSVFDMYEPHIIYREIILLDSRYERSGAYYLPVLEEADCLDEKSELNLDRSRIRKGVIDYGRTEGKAVFRVGGLNHYYMAGRLDLVESILKRDVKGIGLTELEVCQDYGSHRNEPRGVFTAGGAGQG